MITIEQAVKRYITKLAKDGILKEGPDVRRDAYVSMERWQDLADALEARGNRPFHLPDGSVALQLMSAAGRCYIRYDKALGNDQVRVDVHGVCATYTGQLEFPDK